MTIPDTTAKRIDKLLKSARNAANATNQDQRDAARRFTVQRALELCDRRDALIERMDAGWGWLSQIDAEYPVPDIYEEQVNRANRIREENADYAANEEKLISWQAEYEAICQALDEAADTWLGQQREAA